MKKINLQAIIDKKGLDLKKLARELFPSVKYPDLALKRVLSGEGLLDADQIAKLASITGEDISSLFGPVGEWSSKASEESGVLVLVSDDFKAELKTHVDPMITTIYHKGSLVFEDIITSKAITVPEFINYLNNQIKILQNGKN